MIIANLYSDFNLLLSICFYQTVRGEQFQVDVKHISHSSHYADWYVVVTAQSVEVL